MSKNKQSYITLDEIRFDPKLSANAKLLYGEIQGLCNNEKGYCWATDQWFATAYHVDLRTVKRWINELTKYGYIAKDTQYVKSMGRKVRKILIINRDEIAPIDGDKNVPIKGQNCHKHKDKNVPYSNENMSNTTTTRENKSVVVVPSELELGTKEQCGSDATTQRQGNYPKEGKKNQKAAVQRSSNAGGTDKVAGTAVDKSDSFLLSGIPSSEVGLSLGVIALSESPKTTTNNSEAAVSKSKRRMMTAREIFTAKVLCEQFGFLQQDALNIIRKYDDIQRIQDGANYAGAYRQGKRNLPGWCVSCIEARRKLPKTEPAPQTEEQKHEARRLAMLDELIQEQKEHEAAKAVAKKEAE